MNIKRFRNRGKNYKKIGIISVSLFVILLISSSVVLSKVEYSKSYNSIITYTPQFNNPPPPHSPHLCVNCREININGKGSILSIPPLLFWETEGEVKVKSMFSYIHLDNGGTGFFLGFRGQIRTDPFGITGRASIGYVD